MNTDNTPAVAAAEIQRHFGEIIDVVRRDLPPLPDRAYYLREIDALLAGETDQQIVDALLDRRLDLMDRNS